MDLAGKGVLITGARRVGGAVARRLAAQGMRVALGYRSSAAAMQALADELAPVAGPVPLVQGDLAEEAAAARTVATARERLGGLYAVVNLASDFERAPLEALDGPAWDRAMASARASYLLALHASRVLRANPGPTRGHVVLFSDWAALGTPYRGYLPYLTAKAAIAALTRGFALELAPHGILVNAVAPGPTLRPPEIRPEDWQHDVLARTPLARESSPEDIAGVVAALLASDTITGEVIRVDAGRHLAGPGWPDQEGA